jgi:hypothetical protein
MKNPLASLTKNQKIGVGAAGVGAVALALKARSGGKAGSGASTTSSSPGTISTADTLAWDLYNSLQPEIEALRDDVRGLGAKPSTPIDTLDPEKPNKPPRTRITYPLPIERLPVPATPSSPTVNTAPAPGFRVDSTPAGGGLFNNTVTTPAGDTYVVLGAPDQTRTWGNILTPRNGGQGRADDGKNSKRKITNAQRATEKKIIEKASKAGYGGGIGIGG